MAGVNKAILIGHLGADPKISRTQDGRMIANFSVATSESWKDKASGERKERTSWHRVVIFNENLAKVAEKHLRKGSKIYVEGAMYTRRWADNNGTDRYVTEVVLQGFGAVLVLLEKKEGGGVPPAESEDSYGSTTKRSSGQSTHVDQPFDDDIPF